MAAATLSVLVELREEGPVALGGMYRLGRALADVLQQVLHGLSDVVEELESGRGLRAADVLGVRAALAQPAALTLAHARQDGGLEGHHEG